MQPPRVPIAAATPRPDAPQGRSSPEPLVYRRSRADDPTETSRTGEERWLLNLLATLRLGERAVARTEVVADRVPSPAWVRAAQASGIPEHVKRRG